MREAVVARAWGAFDLVFRPWMGSRVGPVLVTGLPSRLPGDRPLILCPNHVSWWDGFLVRALQREMRPSAPLLTVMLERELRRRPFLRLLGGLGFDPGAPASLRGVLRALRRARRRRPDVVATLFPQGRMRPDSARPLGFQPGVRLVAGALAPAVVLPVALYLAFGREPRATAFISVGRPVHTGDVPPRGLPRVLERRVERELDAVRAFVEEHGEDAPRAWPGPLGRLPVRRPPPAAGALISPCAGMPTVWPGRN